MKDIKVEFIDKFKETDYEITYVVIPSRYNGKWVYGRHKERSTWEVPGGHIEKGETSYEAAERELYEETGAVEYTLNPVCLYNVKVNNTDSFGVMYFADIKKLSDNLEYEIIELMFSDNMPDELTYPDIQPLLFNKVKKYIKHECI